MIKVFKAETMNYTPFGVTKSDPANTAKINKFWQQQQIEFIDNPENANLIISRKIDHLLDYRRKFINKKYLIWTHEPRLNTSFSHKIHGWLILPDIYIMNLYTGNVSFNNYNWFYHGNYTPQAPLNHHNFASFKHKKIVALLGYRPDQNRWSLKRQRQELDLCYLRTQIALEGCKVNKIDIYGQDWPEGISKENSREMGNWHQRKMEILPNYHFNLCLENTNIDYYCTEKIWDSIAARCLPIYYGKNNKIYETFPENSFLDYAQFQNPQDLFNYIDNLKESEFIQRLNLCIEVFNNTYNQRKSQQLYNGFSEAILFKIVEKIKALV